MFVDKWVNSNPTVPKHWTQAAGRGIGRADNLKGAEPGHLADLAEDRILRKYAKEFPGFSQESSP